MIALDVVRLEAGLILLEVDYTSARHAMNSDQAYSPGEIGLGKLVDFEKGDFVGRRALLDGAPPGRAAPAARRARDQLAGHRRDVQRPGPAARPRRPSSIARRSRSMTPGGRQVGRITSHGWSPILKKPIALASVPPAFERPGTQLQAEWTVEARRGRVGATVVELPFLDLPRKRA